MGPIWGRQDPGETRFGPMHFAIWDKSFIKYISDKKKLNKENQIKAVRVFCGI